MDNPTTQQAIKWLYEHAPAYYAEAVEAGLAKARGEVAEEIAAAIEETVGGYPDNDAERPKVGCGELLNDADWAARIAREHGKGN